MNKLDVIEQLLKSPANTQAVIANTINYEIKVDNFVVNAERKLELKQYAESLIGSLEPKLKEDNGGLFSLMKEIAFLLFL